MKKSVCLLALFTAITCVLFTACGNKKMQASKARIERLKKDSIETHQKVNENNTAAAKKSTPAVTNHNISSTSTGNTNTKTSPNNNTAESFVPIPPIVVENTFKTKYPTATDVSWKELPAKDIKLYRVDFAVDENKNSATYSKNGDLVEMKEQILPDQLPQNIYDAIKTKYPDFHIVYAASYKNKTIGGSYCAVIKTLSHAEEIEIILMENGTVIR